MKKGSLWREWAVPVGLALLGGCATKAHRVSCDQRLEPINAPVPKVAESQDKKPSLSGPEPGPVTP